MKGKQYFYERAYLSNAAMWTESKLHRMELIDAKFVKKPIVATVGSRLTIDIRFP